MTHNITRRQALGLLTGLLGHTALASARRTLARNLPADRGSDAWVLKGRAIHTVVFYEEASTQSPRLATRARDQSFEILGEVRAPFSAHNNLWYHTPLGYVHSAWVLPVRVYPPQPFIEDIGAWGFWGEVAQIYAEGRTAPAETAPRQYRFYGGSVFHVIDAARDAEGNGWYKVLDDFPPRDHGFQWVSASDLRRIPRAEIAPIHPFAGEKHLVIDLAAQMLTCYEGEREVFATQAATGTGGRTPRGEFCVLLKQASRHMSNRPYPDGPEPTGDIFDLPGVPWVVFFDLIGNAIHGAYWHNDYGIVRSSGCVNVPIDAARWIYRWTYPIGGFEDGFIQSTCRVGTPIVVR